MKGAKTADERLWLIKNLAGVICVSNYIKSCFLEGLTGKGIKNDSVQSVLNGAAKSEKLHLPNGKPTDVAFRSSMRSTLYYM